MGMGKIKDAWPVWALVVAGVIVIALAFGQNKTEKDAVTFHDIFPEEQSQPKVAVSPQTGTGTSGTIAVDPVQSPAIVANTGHNTQNLSYAIQLYSFREQSRADSIVNKLKADGVPAYAQISDLGTKGTWYRVRVGSYKNADEAQAVLVALIKDHKDSIIVKDRK